MGSKNRIFLGIIIAQILHHHRNIFTDDKLVISKKKASKIKIGHPNEAKYIYEHHFQNLLDHTIASCFYKQDGILNFIVQFKGSYLLYGISINNYRNELSTIFKPSVRQLIRCKENMKFFSEDAKRNFEDYLER